MLNKLTCLSIVLVAALSSCRREETFPAIGDKIASPIDVAVSESGEYFYVLNSDFARTYNAGSVVVLDQEGNKVTSVEVPRMGRSLTATDKDLIVTTDVADDQSSAEVLLFDITDPKAPALKKTFQIGCSPLNAVARSGYDYFFVSCTNNTIHVGKLEADRGQSWIKRIRQYPYLADVPSRALYLDTKRELLLGFKTDVGKQSSSDREAMDVATYDKDAVEIKDDSGNSVADEVPDDMQSTKREIAASGGKVNYQFFVLDIKAEKENAPNCEIKDGETCSFPLRDNTDKIVKSEQRWLYFHLNNFDGTPDTLTALDPNYKYYRTNFWDAKPDPFDPDTFYLSHRGMPSKSAYANQIVKVQFTGDLHTDSEGKAPRTGDVFSFERISGFKGEGQNGEETTKLHFPGDFELTEIDGQKMLIVNHFRDIGSSTWKRSETYFSLTAKTLDENSWFTELPGTLSSPNITTYYQIAVNRAGKAVSCSFYGDAVILLEVTPGVGIRELKRIE